MSKNNDMGRSFLLFAAVLTSAALVFLFLRKDNVFRWIQAGFTIHRQEKEIESLKRDNARMDEEIRLLTTDRDSLETFAREKFYFAAPGDDVYIIEQ